MLLKNLEKGETSCSHEGPAFFTRKKHLTSIECSFCSCNLHNAKVLPLREVPVGGMHGGIGYVNVPLTSMEVRKFKKEMKNLLSDPLGLAEQLIQFLGPNVFTWKELNSIMQILFSPEERQMIRTAGIQIWDRENNQGPIEEQKLPLIDPTWNPNTEGGRRSMVDYQTLIIRGIKEAVPRVNNMKKAFCGKQGKDESPTAWLTRLRNNMQLYSGIDLESMAGQTMLKVDFITHSRPDIRKKLEKLEGWPEWELDELLKKAQKVYIRQDKEKMKTKAEILMAVTNGENEPSEGKPLGKEHEIKNNSSSPRSGKLTCFYCKKDILRSFVLKE